MKKLLLIAIALLAFSHIGWISESGDGVVSEENVVSATSIEATQVMQSDLLTLLYGETRLGGATNYASFDSAGRVSFDNVAVNDVIQLKNQDSISWLGSSGSVSFQVRISGDNAFVLPTSLEGVTILSANSAEIGSFRGTEASIDVLGVGNQIIASGNVTFVGVSADNVTTTNATVTKADITTGTITTGTITAASADNVTTTNATISGNLDVASIDVAAIDSDDYRTGGVSGITSDYTVGTAPICIVSVDAGIITKWTC